MTHNGTHNGTDNQPHDERHNDPLCRSASKVLDTEIAAIQALKMSINDAFAQACRLILDCKGRVVVLGMGKSGHVGGKIAATFASTGTPAFFVHPGEASHGDIGMITQQDVVLALSYSGSTTEILTILPSIKRRDIPLISITGNRNSALARGATVNLDIGTPDEAGPFGLAPTSSTTATLVLGDALAIALLEAREFTAEDFARSHPGGQLGRRLLLLIDDIMHTGPAMPKVLSETLLNAALIEMTGKRLGMTLVTDDQDTLLGVFTDGDLRRAMDKGAALHTTPIKEIMSQGCKTVQPGMLAVDALELMETHKITALPVIDHDNRPVGVIHIHDILAVV